MCFSERKNDVSESSNYTSSDPGQCPQRAGLLISTGTGAERSSRAVSNWSGTKQGPLQDLKIYDKD